MEKQNNTMEVEFRLKKYLSKLSDPTFHMYRLNEYSLRHNHIIQKTINKTSHWQAQELKDITPYSLDEYFGMCFIGDLKRYLDWPILTKARPYEPRRATFNVIAFRSNYVKPIADKVAWSEKESKAIWRGPLTDTFKKSNSRLLLVKNFYNHKHIDVGLTSVMWTSRPKEKYIKENISMEAHFNYKYIISLPGNDVCNNLLAILNSNSIALMPIPKREGWLLESCLIPWVHFVPINEDMTDLEEKIKWCKRNDKRCRQIVTQANMYAANFKDEESECALQSLVVKNYFDGLTFTCKKELKANFLKLVDKKKNIVFD